MNSEAAEKLERRMRTSGVLILVGLAIQVATLAWNNPISFLAFILGGLPLIAAGVGLYLYSLVNPPH